MRQIIYPVLLLLLIMASACQQEGNREKKELSKDTIPVSIMPIVRDTISPVFKTSGHFTTNNETPLSFKNGGIIHKIYVKEGDKIKKGQLLATVYGTEVRSATQQADLALKKAKRDYQRALHLYQDSVATLEQMQNAKTALQVAKQQKKAATFNKKHSEIRALGNGYVLERFLNEGQMAPPGQPVFLVNSATQSGWIFKTGVSDYQWASIHIGDSAKITTDAAPNKTLQAKVSKKSKGIDPKTGFFIIQLSIQNKKNVPLASGLFGKASIYPSVKLKGWSIPYNALLDGDKHTGYVFITNNKIDVEKRKVHLSKIRHKSILVDKGLNGVKYLIIAGSPYLKEGSTIKIQP